VSCLLRIQFRRIAGFRILSHPIVITNVNFSSVDRSVELFSRHDHGIWRRKFCHRLVHWGTLGGFSTTATLGQRLESLGRFLFWLGWRKTAKLKFWNGPVRAITGHTSRRCNIARSHGVSGLSLDAFSSAVPP
jgi:hypothetical protein